MTVLPCLHLEINVNFFLILTCLSLKQVFVFTCLTTSISTNAFPRSSRFNAPFFEASTACRCQPFVEGSLFRRTEAGLRNPQARECCWVPSFWTFSQPLVGKDPFPADDFYEYFWKAFKPLQNLKTTRNQGDSKCCWAFQVL